MVFCHSLSGLTCVLLSGPLRCILFPERLLWRDWSWQALTFRNVPINGIYADISQCLGGTHCQGQSRCSGLPGWVKLSQRRNPLQRKPLSRPKAFISSLLHFIYNLATAAPWAKDKLSFVTCYFKLTTKNNYWEAALFHCYHHLKCKTFKYKLLIHFNILYAALNYIRNNYNYDMEVTSVQLVQEINKQLLLINQ